MKTKICNKCKERKSVSEFWKNKNEKDGLCSWCKKCQGEYKEDRPKKFWCIGTISSHKYNGHEVLFNFKDLFPLARKTDKCSICDCRLNWNLGTGYSNNSPSLDRINNEKILTLNNVQIICKRCNATKYDRTMHEFIKYCEMVVNKRYNYES